MNSFWALSRDLEVVDGILRQTWGQRKRAGHRKVVAPIACPLVIHLEKPSVKPCTDGWGDPLSIYRDLMKDLDFRKQRSICSRSVSLLVQKQTVVVVEENVR